MQRSHVGTGAIALASAGHNDDSYFRICFGGIERSEDNPSWEPYANESLRASEPFAAYCRRSDVQAELGKDFIASDAAEGAPSDKQRKTKPMQ